jgi:hypothetical protein
LICREVKLYLGSIGRPVKETALQVLYDLEAIRHKKRVGIEINAIRFLSIREAHKHPSVSNQTEYNNRAPA